MAPALRGIIAVIVVGLRPANACLEANLSLGTLLVDDTYVTYIAGLEFGSG
jgi:hypothetical protein